MNQTLAEIEDEKQLLILEKIVENDVTFRELNWVERIVENLVGQGKMMKEGLPINLRAALEAIEEQVKIMGRNKSMIEMGTLLTYEAEE
jgi:hypothetical protein